MNYAGLDALSRTSPVRAAGWGAGGIVGLVMLAAALRSPIDPIESEPAASASASETALGAAPSARKEPRATPPPAPPESGARLSFGSEADAIRSKAIDVAQRRRYKDIPAAFEGIARLDPDAATQRELREAIVRMAMDVMVAQGSLVSADEVDRVYEIIGTKLGATGPDILLELVMTRGGSRGAEKAALTLRDEDVLRLGTDAMRVAYELRAKPMSCISRQPLFSRAMQHGDRRAWKYLEELRSSCSGQKDACCLELRDALDAFKAKGID